MKNAKNSNLMDINALFQQASTCYQQGRLAEAESLAERILKIEINQADTHHLLGLIAIRRGQYDLAGQLIGRAINTNPRQISFYNTLGFAMHQAGRLEEALSACERVIQLKPRSEDAHNNKGVILRELGRFDDALAAFDRAIKLRPQLAEAHCNRGQVLWDLDRPEEALMACERAIKLNPRSAEAHNIYGVVLKGLGRTEEVLLAYERAIRLKPQLAEAHTNRGALLLETGRMKEALAACEQAIQYDPRSVNAHYNLGLVLMALGRHPEAFTACQQATRLDPHSAEAHYNLGLVLKELGRREEALEACMRATQVNPMCAEAYINLGAMLWGRPEDALAAYERAILLKPGVAEAHVTRAGLLKTLGRLDDAREALKTALRYDPGSNKATYMLASLGEGEAPPQSPGEYIVDLFDDYADRFDIDLVDRLGYRAPRQLFEVVNEHLENNIGTLNILDIGCGTGMCAAEFAEYADIMVGIDLAPRMIAKAKERGIYTDLIEGEICQVLEQFNQKFDLILSGDVFIYIGELGQLFTLASGCLAPGGLFAFSIEDNEGNEDYVLRHSSRYAQSLGYIQHLAEANGLEEVRRNPVTLRYENMEPVAGSVVVLRQPAA